MKKMNKIIALVLTLVMTLSFTVISGAETSTYNALSEWKEFEIGANGGLTLNPETVSVSEELTEATANCSQTYSYTSQVDCLLNFEIVKNASGDKHKGNGTYTIEVAEGNGSFSRVTESQMANYAITAKKTYHIKVTRNYNPAVKDPFIGYTAKLNPQPLNEGSSISVSGDKNIDAYYVFKPSVDGGYKFNLEPSNGCIGTNKNYQVNVYSKVGSSVNEFASYEKGVSKSQLRLYLKANTEYIVEALGYGSTGLGYTFSVENVPVGPGISLVGATSLPLDQETECMLYPFANRRAYTWYSFTAPKDGCFEFVINNKYDANNNGDIIVELRDETFSPVEDENVIYLYDNETDVISNTMKQGETCYLQVSEMHKGNFKDVYSVGVKAREHAHSNKIVVDGRYVMKGCPCELDEAMEYAFWVDDVKIKNATYTGKTVSPKVSIETTESFVKEGAKIEGIPSSAYTVTITSNNKKDVGAAKAKVKFTGSYKGLGTYKVSFKIVPKGTSLSSVVAGNKTFTAKWKKQTSKTTGYELRYATNANMASAKTVAIKSNKTVSKKVSKLKEDTTYYVQVRTYKTVSGKKYCSSWSAKSEVTI